MKSLLGSFVSLFHVFDEEIRDARVKMVTGVATGDVMVAVVIGEHHERFAGLHQCFGILHGVAEVDVVVGRAVANQELAMQVSLLNNDCEKILRELEKLKREK